MQLTELRGDQGFLLSGRLVGKFTYPWNAGDPVDAKPGADDRDQGFRGVEDLVRAVGTTGTTTHQCIPSKNLEFQTEPSVNPP